MNVTGVLMKLRVCYPAPSYRPFSPASPAATRAARGNKGRNTRPERLLRQALWRQGVRFRIDDRRLPGRPDIVCWKLKTVIFVDGDFWHGRNWPSRRKRLKRGSNPEYWIAKIESNRARDRKIGSQLGLLGWTVIRIWENDIRLDPARVVNRILQHLQGKRSGASTG